MLRRISIRRLVAGALLFGALFAAMPAAGLAANGGGGPRPVAGQAVDASSEHGRPLRGAFRRS